MLDAFADELQSHPVAPILLALEAAAQDLANGCIDTRKAARL